MILSFTDEPDSPSSLQDYDICILPKILNDAKGKCSSWDDMLSSPETGSHTLDCRQD